METKNLTFLRLFALGIFIPLVGFIYKNKAKSLLILFTVCVMSTSMVFAEGTQQPQIAVATTHYVENSIATKQDVLDSTKVLVSGTGNAVTNITADNGIITVEKSNTAYIPVGSSDATVQAQMWLQ